MDHHTSTNIIAHKALEGVKSRGIDKFTLRPWNQYKPDNTLWWLVPTKNWPAYRHGKIAIYKTKQSNQFKVGFHLEKGLSDTAGQMLPPRSVDKLCIKPDWIWNTFVNDIKTGKFAEILAQIAKSLNKKIEIIIQASAIKDKESSVASFEDLKTENIIKFIYDGVSLEWNKDAIKGEMRTFAGINTIERFLDIFQDRDMEWFWIDFFAVVEIPNSDWHQIETIVPSFIEHYRGIF